MHPRILKTKKNYLSSRFVFVSPYMIDNGDEFFKCPQNKALKYQID
jgi:hypothetical protein